MSGMEFYEDIERRGGLVSALQSTLNELGFSLTVLSYELLNAFLDSGKLPEYARVELGKKVSQVFMHAQRRQFLFDLWENGHCLGIGEASTLLASGRAIGSWLTTDIEMSFLATTFPYVTPSPGLTAYESGKDVEFAWHSIAFRHPELRSFVELAAAHPIVGKLFPYTSLGRLCLSRCTGYPYTADCPIVLPESLGKYMVTDIGGRCLGKGTSTEALETLAAHLPHGIAPAIRGTARDLDSSPS